MSDDAPPRTAQPVQQMPASILQAGPAYNLQHKPVQKPSSKWDDFVEPEDCPDMDSTTQRSPHEDATTSCMDEQLPLQAVENMPSVHGLHAKPLPLHADTVIIPPAGMAAFIASRCDRSLQHRSLSTSSGESGPAQALLGSQSRSECAVPPQPTSCRAPVHQAHVTDDTGNLRSEQQHADSKKPFSAPAKCRQGFKPPSMVVPSRRNLPHGSKQSPTYPMGQAVAGVAYTDPLLAFFGLNTGPALRHVAVPTCFASLQQYKQVWSSAVTEELSIR